MKNKIGKQGNVKCLWIYRLYIFIALYMFIIENRLKERQTDQQTELSIHQFIDSLIGVFVNGYTHVPILPVLLCRWWGEK